MGIDIHAYNFIKLQAAQHALGKVLTVGRQTLDVEYGFIEMDLGKTIERTGYCEPMLLTLNAESVDSLDISDYEGATYVADLNQQLSIDAKFNTIIDAGSLEHVFDLASAFRNTINLCKIGGRIIHFLPVNNLNGHGFWQFSSDLLYSIYSEENGFLETAVYYASSLDSSFWYKVPVAKPGVRIEIVSLEPIILLSVTRKVRDVESISVMQPFYAPTWNPENASRTRTAAKNAPGVKNIVRRVLARHGRLRNWIRNFHLIFGLITGLSQYSLKCSRFQKIRVDQALQD
ncbi:MAG: hypothetical protein IH606_02885 [Burkholderiales bacterium]|nr:hypothetical protein [Burkholderiales bacterium]